MPEYTVAMLKRANRLNLTPGNADAHIIAWAHELDVSELTAGAGSRYLALKSQFVQDTTPYRYRLAEDGVDHLLVRICECECLCLECWGTLVECGICQCEARELACIPGELVAKQIIACEDNPIRLVQVAIGKSTNSWQIDEFRTVQYALFRQLGMVDAPLSDD